MQANETAKYDVLYEHGVFGVEAATRYRQEPKKPLMVEVSSIFTKAPHRTFRQKFYERMSEHVDMVAIGWWRPMDNESKEFTMETYARDLFEALDAVKGAYGTERIDVLKADSSGMATLALAARYGKLGIDNLHVDGGFHDSNVRWAGDLRNYYDMFVSKVEMDYGHLGYIPEADVDQAFAKMQNKYGYRTSGFRLPHTDLPLKAYLSYLNNVKRDEFVKAPLGNIDAEKVFISYGMFDHLTDQDSSMSHFNRIMSARLNNGEQKVKMQGFNFGHAELLSDQAVEADVQAMRHFYPETKILI
jgi:hypothetical protein